MGQYDVALGLSAAAINQALIQLDAKPQAHEKFFKGTVHGGSAGQEITVDWEISQVPTVTLSTPTPEQWKESIGPDGKPVAPKVPVGHLFQVSVQEVSLTGGHSKKITGLVLYAKIDMCADVNGVSITPLAVNETGSNLEGFDRVLFNALVVPGMFRMLSDATRRLDLPPLSQIIFGKQFTFVKPVLTIAKGYVVLATSEEGHSLDITSAVWPEKKTAFLLAKPVFAISVMKPKIDEEVTELNQQGSGKSDDLKYIYDAAVRDIPEIQPKDDDPLTMTAVLTLDVSADVSAERGICAASAATSNT